MEEHVKRVMEAIAREGKDMSVSAYVDFLEAVLDEVHTMKDAAVQDMRRQEE